VSAPFTDKSVLLPQGTETDATGVIHATEIYNSTAGPNGMSPEAAEERWRRLIADHNSKVYRDVEMIQASWERWQKAKSDAARFHRERGAGAPGKAQ
jgi:hypothetical protein